MKGDAVLGLTQEGGAGGLGSEYTGPTFDAELVLEPAVASYETDDGLGKVDVEVVADDVPPAIELASAQQPAQKAGEILFGPGIADHALDLAGGNIEGCN